jgi:hypothetical protein
VVVVRLTISRRRVCQTSEFAASTDTTQIGFYTAFICNLLRFEERKTHRGSNHDCQWNRPNGRWPVIGRCLLGLWWSCHSGPRYFLGFLALIVKPGQLVILRDSQFLSCHRNQVQVSCITDYSIAIFNAYWFPVVVRRQLSDSFTMVSRFAFFSFNSLASRSKDNL